MKGTVCGFVRHILLPHQSLEECHPTKHYILFSLLHSLLEYFYLSAVLEMESGPHI